MCIKCKCMKKLYILLVLFIACVSCDSFGNKEGIKKAKNDAVEAVNKAKDKAINDARNEIAKVATSQLMEANDSIKKAIENAKTTIKAETSAEIESKLKAINNRIKGAALLGLMGTVFGVVGLIVACLAYKRAKISRRFVNEILSDAIYNNDEVKNRIEMLVKTSANDKQTNRPLTQKNVEDILRLYLYSSNEFKNFIYNCVKGQLSQQPSNTGQVRNESSTSSTNPYELFARDSMSNTLSNVQASFQQGKSVYKLILANADSTNAEVTLCIEREDVKQRILGNDSQFIEAICEVKKSTSSPTEIYVREKGLAEKIGDDWRVTKKILVEFK